MYLKNVCNLLQGCWLIDTHLKMAKYCLVKLPDQIHHSIRKENNIHNVLCIITVNVHICTRSVQVKINDTPSGQEVT